ncbi:MAG: acetate/propionate family kinase [Desulfuromonas sp.]|nr:acetate/propionate family kinase [Desulfuromonas sp.]
MAILTLSCRQNLFEYCLFESECFLQLASGTLAGIGCGDRADLNCDHISGPIVAPVLDDLYSAIEYLVTLLERAAFERGPEWKITAVGHRVVHGGELFRHSVAIDDEVLEKIRHLERLAPKYNFPNRQGVVAAMALLPAVVHVAIFDTAFHQTIPAHAYIYPLPYAWYKKHAVRRYGFHGSSHLYMSRYAAALLGKPVTECRLLTIHMELGISLCAVAGGKSVDCSMGFTPVEGSMQERRSGTVDPGIPGFIMDWQGLSAQQVEEILNEKSGLSGIVGACSGRREVMENSLAGDARAKLAITMESYSLNKYIGAFLAALGGCDALVFSPGQGELEVTARQAFLAGLESFGVVLDVERNANAASSNKPERISHDDSVIQIWVVPTHAERIYAEDTALVCAGTCREPWCQEYSFI